MNYEEFKREVTGRFMEFIPVKYQNLKLLVRKEIKVNRSLDGISFNDPTKRPFASPVIYIDDMYNEYQQGRTLESVMKEYADALIRTYDEYANEFSSLSLDNMRENIVLQLVNTEKNTEMLKDVPHREFLDLSVIYRCVTRLDEDGFNSFIIKNNLAEMVGVLEYELFALAIVNTRRLFPLEVKNMFEELKDKLPKDIRDFVSDMEEENMHTQWIISNNIRTNGAHAIMYEDLLYALANRIGTDLYIMPSSIHECIAISVDDKDPDELAALVTYVNMTEVDPKDRLSNQVYYYSRSDRRLSIATSC